MGHIIGIDLGTTNSCVCVMEGGEPAVIPNAEGSRTTPSVVAFSRTGERMVGDLAKRQTVTNHERTICSIKRDMGSDRKVNIDGKRYTPQEISAMVLQKLKADAESYLGGPVTEAVITVPAYFTDAQRQATKDAGKIAGLDVKRIINEPTAAALAYGMDKEESQKIMVYDLGGGTFDVSILEISDHVIEVLATAGNNHLGGDDFDDCVAEYLVKEFRREHRLDLSRDPVAMQRIREAAEKAKIELSAMSQTDISLPYITAGRDGPLHLEVTLTRARFNELTAHLVQATRGPVEQAINDSGVPIAEISKVLMVGGSTRIPAVQELVHSMTGRLPFKGINPDECVAMGASLIGCDAPEPRHRDRGRYLYPRDRAQHHASHQKKPDLHHRRQLPDLGGCPCAAGRAPSGTAEQGAGTLPTDRHPQSHAGRAPDRGDFRHRCQRHRQCFGKGSGHRHRSGDHHHRFLQHEPGGYRPRCPRCGKVCRRGCKDEVRGRSPRPLPRKTKHP